MRWGYTFEPEGGGTRLTEYWEFLPAGVAGFRERCGAKADAEIDNRRAAAESRYPGHARGDQEDRRSLSLVSRRSADSSVVVNQRLMQRNPMWLMPVSTGCGRRAAGR